jgi:formamidopyrimidine-DNA glycosylase
MPELPDVAVFGRYLEGRALGQPVSEVEVSDARLVRGVEPPDLSRRLHGRRFTATYRHGKHLFTQLDNGSWLEWHFGMTGHLDYGEADGARPSAGHVRLGFRNGMRLDFIAPRKLGHIQPVEDPSSFVAREGLGPDALDPALDGYRLGELARGRRKAVKCWLMEQETLAGVGNVYSDEILFHARLHPRRQAAALDAGALARLQGQLRTVLEAAIAAGVDPAAMPADFLLPHRDSQDPCPRCGGPLQSERICGRTAWLCPACQPESGD